MNPINLEKYFSWLFPLGAKSSALPAQSKLTQNWKPGPLYQREPQDHSGSLLSDSSLAVMAADSWNGRVPKITQKAEQGGCQGPRLWAENQDNLEPCLSWPQNLG